MSLLDRYKEWKGEDTVADTTEVSPVSETVSEQIPTEELDPLAVSEEGFDIGVKGESEGFRTFIGQGALFGFGDELEASVRSAFFEDRPYEEIRDEIRGKIKTYQENNPGIAITQEILGSIAPTVAMYLASPVTGGTSAAAATTNVGRLMNVGKEVLRGTTSTGAKAGTVAGLGYSTAEDVTGMTTDAIIGGVFGKAFEIGGRKVGEAAKKKIFQITDYMREKIGGEPSRAALQEIDRLVKGTGKSVDEVLQDIADGKILAENRSLAATVRAIYAKDVVEAGSAADDIQNILRGRAGVTKKEALKTLENELMPKAKTSNVFKEIKDSDEVLQATANKGYKAVFEKNPTVTDDVAIRFENISQRYPKLADEIAKYYDEAGLVPLFKTMANGERKLARMPSLEDSEVLYRLMRDETHALYQAGKGTVANPLKTEMKSYKNLLDNTYSDLADVRILAKQRLQGRDAFREGRKAFGMDADEVQVIFDELPPDAQAQFKAGVLAAFRNKARRTKMTFGKAADENSQEAAIIKIVAGEKNYNKTIQKQLDIAGENNEAINRVLYGSMTQPQKTAEKAIGSSVNASDVIAGFNGDPIAIAAVVSKKLLNQGKDVKLAPKDYEDVAAFLLSDDPEFVAKVLNNAIDGGRVNQKIAQVMDRLTFLKNKAMSKYTVGGITENVRAGERLENSGLLNMMMAP